MRVCAEPSSWVPLLGSGCHAFADAIAPVRTDHFHHPTMDEVTEHFGPAAVETFVGEIDRGLPLNWIEGDVDGEGLTLVASALFACHGVRIGSFQPDRIAAVV